MFNFPATLRGPSGFTYPYSVENSCMFDSASVSYAYRNTNPTATSATTGTVSVWVKRSAITGVEQAILSGRYNDNNQGRFSFTTVDKFQVVCKDGGSIRSFVSDAVFRDCSGWYHFVIAVDGTQVTGSDRINVYCNGELLSGTYATALNMQFEGFLGSASVASIGRRQRNAEMYFNGYLAEIVGVDGQQLTATSFGQFKQGIWVPKKYTGTYGLAGCHVKFENSADLGNDSANVLDYTLVNIGTDHQTTSTPTNNHATFDDNITNDAGGALKEGATKHTNGGAFWRGSFVNFLMKTGKWYWEVVINGDGDDGYAGVGALGEESGAVTATNYDIGTSSNFKLVRWDASGGVFRKYNGGAGAADTNLATPAGSDVMMYAFDADEGKLWMGNNGTWANWGSGVGVPSTGTNPTFTISSHTLYDWCPVVSTYSENCNLKVTAERLSYTPPTGFKLLNAKNLPEPTFLQPSNGFDVVLYEGTGAELAITDLNFTPDFVWIKNRDAADSHQVFDSVRGATNAIEPDTTAAENTDAQSLKTFDSSGFTLGTMAEVNTSAESYVACCMKKGAKYGFDIVGYEGTGANRTVAHNLGAVPELIVVKNRETAGSYWCAYHKDLTSATYALYLNETNGQFSAASYWNSTAPTSSVFSLGTWGWVNENLKDHVAYLWRSIAGFSKVFTYVGNSSTTDGPFVNCGFRPRWVIIKDITRANAWMMYDAARDTYNQMGLDLSPDLPNAEPVYNTDKLDFLANGFKIRTSTSRINFNNDAYVGIAIAEQPGKFSNAR